MKDRKYQTIDPLILETLNLNEKRIHHIFDILHGRDSSFYSAKVGRGQPRQQQEHSRLPNISQHRQHNQSPQPAQYSLPKQRAKQLRSNPSVHEQQYPVQPVIKSNKPAQKPNKRALNAVKSQRLSIQDSPNQQVEQSRPAYTQRQSMLAKDYGMSQVKKSRSLQINPKDVYRLEIQNIVGRYTPVQGLEEEQRLMARLKKRYQHLRKFDKNYYTKLCQPDFLLI